MFKIQTLNAISPVGLKQFPEDMYKIYSDLPSPDAILVRSYSLHSMVMPDSVKAIGRAGAGVNNIPVEFLTKRGIPVFNTPGANANAVRELVVAGMLTASRRLCQAWDYVQQWAGEPEFLHSDIEHHKKRFVGTELAGKTLGVIGLGSIGVKVANIAVHLGMRVIGFDPTITVNCAWELSSSVQQAYYLADLLTKADFVSVHVPLLENTKNLLNADKLRLMKPSATLLNFARDGIVDETALLALLNDERLHLYVTDFPTIALLKHPRVLAFPHLGASTKEAEENCATMVVKQVRNFLEHGAIINAVNFPMVDVSPLGDGFRIAIFNKNVPSMVAKISSTLADAGLNIVNLTNKSQGDMAYTLVDLSEAPSTALIDILTDIEGIVGVRALFPSDFQREHQRRANSLVADVVPIA